MSSPRMNDVVLHSVDVHRSFFKGAEVPVLRGVDVSVRQGEFVSITGQSGSGKTTLLHILGTLDQPTTGEVYWKGERIDNQSASVRDHYRNRICGFVFQFYHLLPELSALENVLLPQMIRLSTWEYLSKKRTLRRKAEELLDRVGLSHRMKHRPIELSGGEMQRTAIARALLAEPELLLADEPTGNLDAQTGASVFELLNQLRREVGLTLILVTHDLQLAARADRMLRLEQGRLAISGMDGGRARPALAVI